MPISKTAACRINRPACCCLSRQWVKKSRGAGGAAGFLRNLDRERPRGPRNCKKKPLLSGAALTGTNKLSDWHQQPQRLLFRLGKPTNSNFKPWTSLLINKLSDKINHSLALSGISSGMRFYQIFNILWLSQFH